MASSCSALNSPQYDVFLSFRGADTRNNFTSHLYNALRKEGVKVFMDKELERGEEISSTLFLIIETSQISIIVFSPNYAASKFCLNELVKILECKASRRHVVLPVFYKVDPFEVEKQTRRYGKAISRHEAKFKGFKRLFYGKQTIKEKMEKVTRWKLALSEAADLAGWDLRNCDEAEIIQDIVKSVLQMLNHGHLDSNRIGEGLALDTSPMSKEVFPEKRLVDRNFGINKEDIWAWLAAADVSSIGVWGMGGVGKTTLMIHIYNKLIEKQEVFGQVFWVTVSQDFNVYKLQNLIAKAVGVDFGIEDDVIKRAARLLKLLSSKGRFILILDDLWNCFDVEELGIPIETKGCKLIITTRNLDVCTQMCLQKIKKIEPLSEEEAWYLFNEKIRQNLDVNVEMIAKSIVRECAGLPLGIVTIAGSMRGVDDIHEWKNALTELQRSELRPEDMGDKVFRILRFSYTRLRNSALQDCILYCALFPEDHEINRDKLIKLLVVEGIIEQRNSWRMNFDKGHVMLNKLVKVSLLEDVRREGGVRRVKMHDLIRDMAIQITRKRSPSIIEAGCQLKHMPEEKSWTPKIVRVSLMSNGIYEIPSRYSPTSSGFSTLFLSQNWKLKSIPDSFFYRLHGLKVLDLSVTGMEKLPESIGCLVNLRVLLLRLCRKLCNVLSLEKLVLLEILDLLSCWSLQELPLGLEMLSNLTFLNLYDCGLMKLQPGMLKRLSNLQFLAFDTDLSVAADELAELEELEFLYCCFQTLKEYSEYVQLVSIDQKQPINYFLSVVTGRINKNIEFSDIRPRSQGVDMYGCCIDREIIILNDLQILRMKDVAIYNAKGLCFKSATTKKPFKTELKSLSISDCSDIEYLFHSSSSPSILEFLEALELDYLPSLRALFGMDERAASTSRTLLPNANTFSNLKRFIISRCYTMKFLFTVRLFSYFQNIEDIVVEKCENMEEIIAVTEDEASYGYDPSHSFSFDGHHNHVDLTETLRFNLPKLKSFSLEKLPKLKRICNRQVFCGSRKQFTVRDCGSLSIIPISFPLPSLETLKVRPKEWWDLVQWGDPCEKSILQPQF